MQKPDAPSCERNREPILAVLRDHFADRHAVLEIGSGTGQHAVHFAAAMPWLRWQCSDHEDYLPGIRQWLDEAALVPGLLPAGAGPFADWPHQFRTIEIFDQDNGWLMMRATCADFSVEGDPVAAEGKRRGTTDFTTGWLPTEAVTAKDENVELWIKKP